MVAKIILKFFGRRGLTLERRYEIIRFVKAGSLYGKSTSSKENDMGGHGSGQSSYKMLKQQMEAEEVSRRIMAKERAKATAEANAEASTGEMSGGEGSGDYDGALTAARKKRGATLAGEGAQTFGSNGNLGA